MPRQSPKPKSKPNTYDSELAVAYMTYLINVSDEDPTEVSVFLDTLPEFKGMTTLLDEAGFDFLCRRFRQIHADQHDRVMSGLMPSTLKQVIDYEWGKWYKDMEMRREKYSRREYSRGRPQYAEYDRRDVRQDLPVYDGYRRGVAY